MATLSPIPRFQFFDANGDPLALGSLETYAAGTSTPLATFSDAAGSVSNGTVIALNAAGKPTVSATEVAIYLSSASYKWILKNALGTTIWSQDNITATDFLTFSTLTVTGVTTLGTGMATSNVPGGGVLVLANSGSTRWSFRENTSNSLCIDYFSGAVWTSWVAITKDGLLSVVGAGVHNVAASVDGALEWRIRNASAGTSAYAGFILGNDGTAVAGGVYLGSTTSTVGSIFPANGMAVFCSTAGGVAVGSTHATGTLRFWAGNLERARLLANGDFAHPAAAKVFLDGVAGTGNTYLVESVADEISLVAGGVTAAAFNATGAAVAGSLTVTQAQNAATSLAVTNATSGTAATAGLLMTANTNVGALTTYSPAFTTSGSAIANSVRLLAPAAGGLTLDASNAAGVLHVYTNGAERLRVGTAGDVGIAATAKFYVDGVALTGDTFIDEVSANVLRLSASTVADVRVGAGNGLTITNTTGSTRYTFTTLATQTQLLLASVAYGTGSVPGSGISIGRNTSGSGAAGWLLLTGLGGASNYLWADASAAPGMLRISTAPPEEDGAPADTSGTVVGLQASSRAVKDIFGERQDSAGSLALLLATPIFDFRYKGGSYNDTHFVGITAEDSPAFAMDAGRSFNPVSAFGHTVLAIKALMRRLQALEER